MSAIYVVDIVLLVILYLLIMFMCGYSAFCIYRILRSMQMRILLRPTRVVFSHKKEGDSTEELRTVVAYQNPFTGDYCVHKGRAGAHGYENSLAGARASSDSGLSDEYEPLRPEPQPHPPAPHPPAPRPRRPEPQAQPHAPRPLRPELQHFQTELQRLQDMQLEPDIVKPHMNTRINDNSVNKSWNWNYKEYQI